MKTLKSISHYLIVWYANNFAAPFWIVGHYHILVIANLEQFEQTASLVAVNALTLLGIFLDWRIQNREKPVETENSEELKFFVINRKTNSQEACIQITSGMTMRNLSVKDIIFTREDETYLYVFYKTKCKN